MSDQKETQNNRSKIIENIANIITPENIQKYILGNKRCGQPRALYDIFKDYRKDKRKYKYKKKNKGYSLLLKPKKKKKKKHWRF